MVTPAVEGKKQKKWRKNDFMSDAKVQARYRLGKPWGFPERGEGGMPN